VVDVELIPQLLQSIPDVAIQAAACMALWPDPADALFQQYLQELLDMLDAAAKATS